jgi:hypothetical protein
MYVDLEACEEKLRIRTGCRVLPGMKQHLSKLLALVLLASVATACVVRSPARTVVVRHR